MANEMRDRLVPIVKDSLMKHIGKSCNLAENIVDDLIENGVKTDNRANNSEWCTRSENMKHAYKNGLQTKGKSLVRKIQCVEDGFVYETIGEASRRYNISPKTIQASCARLSTRGKRNFRYYEGERRSNDD